MESQQADRIVALLEQVWDNQAQQLALPIVILLVVYLSWLVFR